VKDKNLLINERIDPKKIHCICPYYSNMFDLKPDYASKNIIFFGAMDNSENYLSAIWFIENVFDEIVKGYPESKFFVVGGSPPSKLLKYNSDNTVITGFVDNPKKYFEKSSLMVAPLLLGGGIKVKILLIVHLKSPMVKQ